MDSNYIEYTSISNFQLAEVYSQVNWLNWIVVAFCLISIIISRYSDYSYIPNLFKINNNFNKNPVTLRNLSSLSLFANYYLVISLFVWQIIIVTDNNLFDPSFLLLIVSISIIGLSLIKFSIIYLIDIIFKRKDHFHIKLHLSYYQATGVILLPFYILSYYLTPYSRLSLDIINKVDFYLILGIVIILIMIIRELKSLFTALKNRIPLLYIILYLCTLEILPLILAIKILKG